MQKRWIIQIYKLKKNKNKNKRPSHLTFDLNVITVSVTCYIGVVPIICHVAPCAIRVGLH